jgi:hypothetical protein
MGTAFGQPAQLGSSVTPAFGAIATPGFGQPAQLGNSMIGGSNSPVSGFGFGQAAQPQSAFGGSFGAAQAPQAPLPSPAATTSPATAFGAAFSNPSGGGGFAALSQNASSAAFGGGGSGGGFAAFGGGGGAASSSSFGSGFAFGGGSTFASNSVFGTSSSFGNNASPFPPAFSSASATSPAASAMFAPRRWLDNACVHGRNWGISLFQVLNTCASREDGGFRGERGLVQRFSENDLIPSSQSHMSSVSLVGFLLGAVVPFNAGIPQYEQKLYRDDVTFYQLCQSMILFV